MAGGAGTEVGRISIKVTPDTDGFRRKLVQDLAGADKDIEIDVKPTGVKQAREEIRKGTSGIESEVDVQPKLDKGRLAAIKAQIAAETDRIHQVVEMQAELDTSKARFEAARFRAAESLKKINMRVDLDTSFVDKLRGLANVKNLVGRTASAFGALGESLSQSAAGARFFGLGMGSILAIATLIPPAIALVAGAVLTLPAIAAGFLVPIGAIALGVEGIKKAAEQLKQPFQELQKIMSDRFESNLTPIFDRLKAVFPTLNEMMPQVADGLSTIADSLVRSITSSEGLANIKTTIAGISGGLTAAAPGVGKFSDAILQLIASVSEKFPGVGEALSRIGDQFNGWISKITTKDPTTGVSQLDTALKTLKETLAPLGGAVGDLFRKGFEKLTDPAFAAGLKQFTEDLRSLANISFDGLSKFFTDISTAISQFSSAIGKVKQTYDSLPDPVKKFFEGEPPKTNQAKPDTNSFFEPFTSKDAPWRQILPNLKGENGTQAQLFGQLAELWGGVTKKGLDLATLSAQDQRDAFKAAFLNNDLLGGGGAFDSALKQQQQAAAVQSKEAADASAKSIIDAFKGSGNLGANADIGTQLSANIKSAVDRATTELRTSMGTLSQIFQEQLAQVGAGSAGAIQGALQPLQQAPALVMNAFAGVSSAIQGSFAVAISVIAQGAGQIATAVGAGLAQVPGAVQLAFANLGAIATAGMTGLVTAVVQGCAQAVAALQPLPGQIAAIGSQLFAAAQSAGAQVGAGMAAGITASTGQAVAAAQSLAAAVAAAAAVKLDINSPSKVFEDIGDNVGKGFVIGVEGQTNNMVGSIKQILEAVKEVFGSANGLNLNFNLGSAQQSMAGLASSTKDFTSNLTDSINPTKAFNTENKAQIEDLKQQLALLEIQRKDLKVQKDAAVSKEDKKAIQAQIDQLQSQKDLLALEKDKLSYAKQYGQESWNAADALKQAGQQSLDAAFAFGKSNIDQLQSDLGIGGGAITGAANALWDWGTNAASQFIFNVSNVDEAIAVKNNQVSKQAMQFTGR